jgi:hypothetical protein
VALVRAAADFLVGGHLNPTPGDEPRTTPSAGPQAARQPGAEAVTALVYELLDAHADTAQLASELELDLAWQAHLQYLRALQRKGREALARWQLDQAA